MVVLDVGSVAKLLSFAQLLRQIGEMEKCP